MRLGWTKNKNSTTYRALKTIRVDGKNRTLVIKTFGSDKFICETYGVTDAKAWAKEQIRRMDQEEKEEEPSFEFTLHSGTDLPLDTQRCFNGGYLFLQQVYYELGLDRICAMVRTRHGFSYNLNSILSRLVYTRILYPSSKLGSYKDSKRFIEQPDFELHQIYRALSVLATESDYIQARLFKNSMAVGKRRTEVIYYDCTNFYFEIEEAEDDKQFGISKENRPLPIVEMGLFMDRDGIPLAFCINPGNENEQQSLIPLEKKLLEKFDMGGVTTYTYTPTGQVSSVTDAMEGVIRYTYDKNDNLVRIVDAEGYTLSYGYDKDNRPVSVTDANGGRTGYAYDANGNVTAVANPDGGTEQYVYDLNDQLISYTDGEGYTTLYAYDENGNLIKETDPRGNSRSAEYDALNRRVSSVNEEGGSILLTYNALGRVTKAVNEDGAVTEYEYDAKGRVTGIKDAYGHYKYFEYDPMDRVTAVTDENGVKREYEYDFKGNLKKYKDGRGFTETYTYDANDNRTSVTDRNGETYYYDEENQIVEMKDFDGGITKFAYDGNGNKTFKEYPNYETAYYFYDECSRIIEMDEYNIGGKKLYKTTYSWDAEGNRLSEMQYNHGQSGSDNGNGNSGNNGNGNGKNNSAASAEAPAVEIPSVDTEQLSATASVVNRPALPDSLADNAAGVVLKNQADAAQETNIQLLNTVKEDASVEGNGDGNGQAPPGQTEDEDGNIVNPGGICLRD